MKKMTIIGLVAMVMLTGCGKSEIPKTEKIECPSETILTENIETEKIIVEQTWDNAVTTWEDVTSNW